MQLFGFYQFFYDLFDRLKYRVYIIHTQSEIGTADGYKKYNNIYFNFFNDCRIKGWLMKSSITCNTASKTKNQN